jgi:hypothetical protein
MIHPTHGVRICSGAQLRVFLSISGFSAGDEAAVLESHVSQIEEFRVDNAKHRMRSTPPPLHQNKSAGNENYAQSLNSQK